MKSRILAVAVCAILCLGLSAHAGDWWNPVMSDTVDKGYPRARWQSSFDEFKIGRMAPINSQACVGVPGWPVMAFGHQMYLRYSEFLLAFRLEKDGVEIKPYTLPGIKQYTLDDYLPAVVTEFDYNNVHYVVKYLMAPTHPQPVDVVEITMTNQSVSEQKGSLVINMDGSPTVKAAADLIDDRGKPLVVLSGQPTEIRLLERPIGIVDPRCPPAGGGYDLATQRTRRDSWYGMPIEYMIKADPGKEYQVYLGTDSVPPCQPVFCYEWPDRFRAVTLTVEGDKPVTAELRTEGLRARRFIGKDVDRDGYIKVSSRATAECRQPGVLNTVYVYNADVTGVDEKDLIERKPKIAPLYSVICGSNAPTWLGDSMAGDDLTWKGLGLRYTPAIKAGETLCYALKMPAIDRVETIPYGASYHPYDTQQTWMRNIEPRHPENKTAYGEDVPPGVDPAEYAAFGPKSRALWAEQLKVAQSLSAENALSMTKTFWDKFLDKRVKINCPDKDLDDLYKSQLAIMANYILKWGQNEVYTVMGGPFNYWDTCLRDGSYQIRALDMVGYHDISSNLSNSLLIPKSKLPVSRWEFGQWDDGKEDGMWRTRPAQWDGQGQTLGALVDHYLFTNDRKWLTTAYQAIARGADWLEVMRDRQKKLSGSPSDINYGLLPSGELESGGSGHPFYINAYGIYGVRQAARAAEALGKISDAQKFAKRADEHQAAALAAARKTFVRFNSYCGTLPIEPNNRADTGTWPGASLVYPTELFQPFDPMMDGWYRYMEAEGANCGGLMGFPYILIDWAVSYIRRGQPDRTVDLFNAYVDTASTMKGWAETYDLNKPYNMDGLSQRSVFGCGDQPHGEACSNYIIIYRNLFLHEEADTLHVAPATPRRWLAQTKPFGMEAAPTYFGKVTFIIEAKPDRKTIEAEVKLDKGACALRHMLVHLRAPGGRNLASVKVNGKNWGGFVGDTVAIDNPKGTINIVATLR